MKIKEILLELNVANIDDVKEYIKITGEGWRPYKGIPPAPIKSWMETQLYRWMINNPKLARLIDKDTRESQRLPSWAKQALNRGEEVVKIVLGSTYGPPNWPAIRNTYVTRVKGQNSTIRNWLMWEYEQDTPESKKLIKSLSHLTIPIAIKKSKIWKKEEQQRKEEEQQRRIKQEKEEQQRKISGQKADKDYKTVMTFKDGFSIVELLSGKCKDLEGDIMQHCMSKKYGAGQKNKRIFSLRDPNNKAHVTIEVKTSSEFKFNDAKKEYDKIWVSTVLYIKGKQNKTPVPKYQPYIITFIKKSKFKLTPRLLKIWS